MDLRSELLKNNPAKQCQKVADYCENDPRLFKELIEIFLEGDYRVSQRAACPIYQLTLRKPEVVAPHLKKLIRALEKPDAQMVLVRNTLRFLQFMEVPKPLHGSTLTVCFRFLTDTKTPIAIAVFAMTVAANLAKLYPEIRDELKLIIEDRLPTGSAGVRSRAKKILSLLN
jgi:hypothetical protein